MPEMNLKQPGFTYSVCKTFTKNEERIQKFIEIGDSKHIYRNELDNFKHDMAYGDFKDLTRKTSSDKILRDKAFNIAKNAEYDGCQRGLVYMVYKFFEKTSRSGVNNKIKQNQQLAKNFTSQLLKDIFKKTSFFFI